MSNFVFRLIGDDLSTLCVEKKYTAKVIIIGNTLSAARDQAEEWCRKQNFNALIDVDASVNDQKQIVVEGCPAVVNESPWNLGQGDLLPRIFQKDKGQDQAKSDCDQFSVDQNPNTASSTPRSDSNTEPLYTQAEIEKFSREEAHTVQTTVKEEAAEANIFGWLDETPESAQNANKPSSETQNQEKSPGNGQADNTDILDKLFKAIFSIPIILLIILLISYR